MSLTADQIIISLKKKDYHPVYFLHGTESYFIDQVVQFAETKILTESERSFNQTILYGKDTDHKTVVDNARRFPMMASHQVVILKEAQDMKSLKDLQTYIEKPSTTTILVIAHKHKRFNMNSKLGKALKDKAVILESKGLYDNQLPGWIETYLKKRKYPISPEASVLIAEYVGTDLSKVVNELDKLILNLPADTQITEKEIEANIGISKDFNIFELQKALGERNILKANRIVNYFAANPRRNPLPVVLGSLYGYFSKIYQLHFVKSASEQDQLNALKLRSAFFLRDYRSALRNYPFQRIEQVIGLLKEYDLKSKGVHYNGTGKPEGELLKELVWRILH
ncbi:MAG: DNA polymerase III subunit delta [Saprospiraceae bacterium]|nr:DNA polymerase III subunit delta [Lewinella sp.]